MEMGVTWIELLNRNGEEWTKLKDIQKIECTQCSHEDMVDETMRKRTLQESGLS